MCIRDSAGLLSREDGLQAILSEYEAFAAAYQENPAILRFQMCIRDRYKGDTLIDSFTTDENGQFTTGYYVCDADWTIREISPSEGYLLDSTIHKVGAEPELYEIELNDTANDVTEQIIKGDIAIIKHTDDEMCIRDSHKPSCLLKNFL